MGTDLSVVNDARASFAKESKFERITFETEEECDEWFENGGQGYYDLYDYVMSDRWYGGYPVYVLSDKDKKLIKYLAKHDHWTPFAHTTIKVRVSAPIPIRTQCFKHKIGFVENEESRRYIKTTPDIFIPEFREKPEGSIKQGSGGRHPDSEKWEASYSNVVGNLVTMYEKMIEDGIAPEQARFILPQGAIVNCVWTGNLVSFANFCNKRLDPNAQQEVQEVARKVSDIIRPLFPVSFSALVGGVKCP
jgi:thymidylate synthase (FAD)